MKTKRFLSGPINELVDRMLGETDVESLEEIYTYLKETYTQEQLREVYQFLFDKLDGADEETIDDIQEQIEKIWYAFDQDSLEILEQADE